MVHTLSRSRAAVLLLGLAGAANNLRAGTSDNALTSSSSRDLQSGAAPAGARRSQRLRDLIARRRGSDIRQALDLSAAQKNAPDTDIVEEWLDTHGDILVQAGPGVGDSAAEVKLVEVAIDGRFYAAVTSPETLARLTTAYDVPLSGFILGDTFVFDPVHMPTRCTHGDGAADDDDSGDCFIGRDRRARVSKRQARYEAQQRIGDGMKAAREAHRPGSANPMVVTVGGDATPTGSSGVVRRVLYNEGLGYGNGARSFLVLRLQMTSQTSGVTITQSQADGVCGQIYSFFTGASYNATVPTVTCPSSCVYTVPTTEAQIKASTYNGYNTLTTQALSAAAAAASPCTVTGSFSHVMLLIPNGYSLGFAGLGNTPGTNTWLNGASCLPRWCWWVACLLCVDIWLMILYVHDHLCALVSCQLIQWLVDHLFHTFPAGLTRSGTTSAWTTPTPWMPRWDSRGEYG